MLPPRDLERLYDEHAPAVFAFLLAWTRHEADARDLLQEAFVKLARLPGGLDGVHDERAFLLRLANNLAIDLFRRRGTRERQHDLFAAEAVSHFAPAADPDVAAFRKRLSVAMDELPMEQRAVVHLKLWAGLTFEQIATTLDLSPNTAASRYRYGVDKLRARLRPLYNELNRADGRSTPGISTS